MAFPVDDLVTTQLDDPADSPALARDQIYQAVLKIQEMIADIDPAGTGLITVTTDGNDTDYAKTNQYNLFGNQQEVRTTANILSLDADTANTTEMLRLLRASGIAWRLVLRNDGVLTINNDTNAEKLVIRTDAKELALTSTDITYGGVSLQPTYQYEESGQLTWVEDGEVNFTFSFTPDEVKARLEFTAAAGGYAIGDKVMISTGGFTKDSANNTHRAYTSLSIAAGSTARFSHHTSGNSDPDSGIRIANKFGGNNTDIRASQTKLVICAVKY